MKHLRRWLRDFSQQLVWYFAVAFSPAYSGAYAHRHPRARRYGTISGMVVVAGILFWITMHPPAFNPSYLPRISVEDVPAADRPAPLHFAPGTHLPRLPERIASGPINLAAFSPERDLVRFDDPRIWWESDHDIGDDEDDHLMHRAVVPPLRRLVAMVEKHGGHLQVHDAYRPKGVHNPRSLHKEGRALDLTCSGLSLEDLARFAWAAGFDWVYYEHSASGGSHIHCSVRARPLIND